MRRGRWSWGEAPGSCGGECGCARCPVSSVGGNVLMAIERGRPRRIDLARRSALVKIECVCASRATGAGGVRDGERLGGFSNRRRCVMSFGSPVFIETFESRMLLSGTPAPVEDPEVVEAKAAVAAAREKLSADQAACRAALEAARAELMEVKEDFKEELEALETALRADREAAKAAIAEQMEAIRDVREEYAPILEADRDAIKAAHEGGDREALAAARAKLAADLKALRAEVAPLVEAMQAEHEAWREKVGEHREAIKDVHEAFRAAFEAELEELKDAKQECEATLRADRVALREALRKLREALDGARDNSAPARRR